MNIENHTKNVYDDASAWYDFWKRNIDAGNVCLEFSQGEQWDYFDKLDYNNKKKVMLTINVLRAYILNIIGEQRQNTSNFELKSSNGKATQKQINIMEEVLREISYSSDADTQYSQVFKSVLIRGFGALIVTQELKSDKTFDKVLKISAFKDPNLVYFDPDAKKLSKTDGDYCGYYEIMSEKGFKQRYPDIENPQSCDIPSYFTGSWMTDAYSNINTIYINNNYKKYYENKYLYKLSNGEEILGDEEDVDNRLSAIRQARTSAIERLTFHNMLEAQAGKPLTQWKMPKRVTVVAKEKRKICKIKYVKSIKNSVLEEYYLYCDCLPMVYVDGDSEYKNYVQKTQSFIENVIDSQKLLNFSFSEIAQYLKEAKRQKFLITKKHTAGYDKQWKNPEIPSMGLPFNPDPTLPASGGAPVPVSPTEVPSTLMSMPSMATSSIQDILGRYDANKGAPGNEVSRVAIAKREQTGNTTIFIYRDNLNKGIDEINKICLKLVPSIYFENKHLTLRKKNGKSDILDINANLVEELKSLEFSVEVNMGPSFAMQKADNYTQLIQYASLDPQNLPRLLGDFIAENIDTPNTKAIVDRIREFYVPPQVIAKEEGKPPPPPPPPDPVTQEKLKAEQMSATADVIGSIADIKKANADLTKARESETSAQIKSDAEIKKAVLSYLEELLRFNKDLASKDMT